MPKPSPKKSHPSDAHTKHTRSRVREKRRADDPFRGEEDSPYKASRSLESFAAEDQESHHTPVKKQAGDQTNTSFSDIGEGPSKPYRNPESPTKSNRRQDSGVELEIRRNITRTRNIRFEGLQPDHSPHPVHPKQKDRANTWPLKKRKMNPLFAWMIDSMTLKARDIKDVDWTFSKVRARRAENLERKLDERLEKIAKKEQKLEAEIQKKKKMLRLERLMVAIESRKANVGTTCQIVELGTSGMSEGATKSRRREMSRHCQSPSSSTRAEPCSVINHKSDRAYRESDEEHIPHHRSGRTQKAAASFLCPVVKEPRCSREKSKRAHIVANVHISEDSDEEQKSKHKVAARTAKSKGS